MVDESRPPVQRTAQQLEQAVADVFAVQDVTLGVPTQPETIRLRGHLLVASNQAFSKIAARLRKIGYTPILRHDTEHDLDVLLAMPGVELEKSGSKPYVNILLYVLTILATLFVGATWSDQVPANADLTWLLTHLWVGWPFALSLMTILTGHELGHYFAGRHYKVPVSLPYFIPLPVPPLGTMGAFITMKGHTADRRQMLTVGATGPLVGFILAVPILILGLALSTVEPMAAPRAGAMVFSEGNSLLYLLLKFALFGKILPGSGDPVTGLAALREVVAALFGTFPIDRGYDVFIHPVALAGWAGMLVTAFNLMPVGQLDGGHVLYSLVGQRARLLTWPVIGILVLLGVLFWQGWLLWAGLIFFLGRSHPDPLDDITRLDASRKIIALVVLLIFILTFTPLPMRIFTSDLPSPGTAEAAACLLVAGLAAWGIGGFRRRARARRQTGTPTGGRCD